MTGGSDSQQTDDAYSILVIEDSKVDAVVVATNLTADGRFSVRHASTLGEGLESLSSNGMPDAITLDLSLPDSTGLKSFHEIHRRFPSQPIVILTGEQDEQLAVQAMRSGAQDYVLKSSLDAAVLIRSLLYAIERNKRHLVEQRQRHVERELQFAKEIQQHLLPAQSPAINGFDIAGQSISSHSASGDFYDFIDHGDGKWDVVLADVCGHGIGPAMITVGTRRLLRSCAAMHEDLGDLMTIANKGICEDTFESLFVTLFFARLDPAKQQLNYVGAGHPAFLIDASGVGVELKTTGIPTGVDADFAYAIDGTLAIDPESILLLMTDGIWEAHNSERVAFGKQRAFDIVHRHRQMPSSEIARRLLDEVQTHCQPGIIEDDVTAVIIKRC